MGTQMYGDQVTEDEYVCTYICIYLFFLKRQSDQIVCSQIPAVSLRPLPLPNCLDLTSCLDTRITSVLLWEKTVSSRSPIRDHTKPFCYLMKCSFTYGEPNLIKREGIRDERPQQMETPDKEVVPLEA